MSEWSKEHAWKVCVLQKGTVGSNPTLSAENEAVNPESAGLAAFVFDVLGKESPVYRSTERQLFICIFAHTV